MNDNNQGYQYHLSLLLVRMRVKFPCKMKIEHNGSLLTAQIPNNNNDNKYIFNQEIILKSGFIESECFQFVLHLVTDKGARYIGGVFKLYHSQMIRSEGQKLTVSLSKCVDAQAFCQIRVNQILSQKENRTLSYGRKSNVTKNVSFKPKQDLEIPNTYRNNLYLTHQQSKTQYNFPSYQTHQKDWENPSKVKYLPPPLPNYSRVKTPSKYNKIQDTHFLIQQSQVGFVTREVSAQAQIYKEGYQKLKQKYRKQAEITKQQTNKRLALQSSQNNMKLEVMKVKLKLQQQEKILQQKTNKIKQLQSLLVTSKQKQIQNGHLRQQLHKRQINLQTLQKTITSMTSDLTELRELSNNKKTQEGYKLRETKGEVQMLKAKLQRKEKQLEHQAKMRKEAVFEKDQQISIKQQQIQKNKKLINDLQKAIQIKNIDLEKYLQNDRFSNRSKLEQQKLKIEKLQKQIIVLNEEKKEFSSKIQQLKASFIQMEYQKKIFNQSFESMQEQSNLYRTLKQKHNQLLREHSALTEQHTQLQQNVQKLAQSKEDASVQFNRQLKEQAEHYRVLIKETEEKERKRTNEISQLQTLLDQSKSQQEKLKKNVDNLNREVQQCKQREKNAKKAVRSKQQQSLGIQTEHATLKQKIKTIDQIYKLQADKIQDQLDRCKQKFQQLSKRHEEIVLQNHRLTDQLTANKAKLQYAQERSERDANNLKDKQQQVQNYFKDTQEQIAGLEKTIANLRSSQKQVNNKLQKIEVDTFRKDQKQQKSKRELKVMEQKCNNYESVLKTKTQELDSLTNDKQLLQSKLMEKETSYNQLHTQFLQISTEKNKLAKIHQIFEDNLTQAKQELAKLTKQLQEQQTKQINFIQTNNKLKQETTKQQFTLNSLRKDIDRNKQAIYENIQKYIFTLLQQPQDKKTKDLLLSDIPTMIVSSGKDLKQMIAKLNDQMKQLQRQKQQLQQSTASQTNRSQSLQSQLKQQIYQLQQQIQNVYHQKEIDNRNFTIIISQLNQKIKEKDYLQQELNAQIEELNFTINSVKLDCDAVNQQNIKKIASLRKMNIELQDKIENFTLLSFQLQQKNNKLQQENSHIHNQLQRIQEILNKKQKSYLQLSNLHKEQQIQMEGIKKKNKEFMEKLSDCQMYLADQRESNQKLKESIQIGEKNCAQLKSFIADLMKQKEISMKNQLQNQQSMTQVQANLLEQIKNSQLLQQQIQRLSKMIQSQKESIKQYTVSLKDNERKLQQQANFHTKTRQKLKQRERQLTSKQQALKKLQQKQQTMSIRFKNESNQLQEQLSLQISTHSKQNHSYAQKITKLQIQLDKLIQQKAVLKVDAINSQEQLYKLRQKYLSSQEIANNYKLQCEQLKIKINFIDANLTQLSDQIRQRQQKLFQFSNQIYSLQLKLDAKQKEKNSKLQELNTNWNDKYQAMCEDYENKLELLEKEREYFKNLTDQRDREVSKMAHYLKVAEQSETNVRKSFQEQIKKQEEQKISQITSKNFQIKKISQELRNLSDNIKSKESQSRRNVNELQMARKTITNLQNKAKQSDQKARNMIKMYQLQVQQLKKKDTANKSLRQNFTNHIWNSERQTKKYIQTFIRSFLQIHQQKNSQKIIDLARTLQNSILQAISFTISQK